MRRERMPGGACSAAAGTVKGPLGRTIKAGVSMRSSATGRMTGCAPLSALTKCCMPCAWQLAETGCGRGQQLCCGWRDCEPSSICGQEKQFPKKRAATTSSTINEVEQVLIQIPGYHVSRHLTIVKRVGRRGAGPKL